MRRSSNVTWHATRVERPRRWASLAGHGETVWFSGLPGSGKSTIAAALEAGLVEDRRPTYLLDGDNLRHGLNGDLGFTPEARAENVRRTAHVAALMADAGLVAIVSLVSPSAADRLAARNVHLAAALSFTEVWVDTPVALCEQRDPKGLYARARLGEVDDFTGVSAPYERPLHPEVRLDGGRLGVRDAVAVVRAALTSGADSASS